MSIPNQDEERLILKNKKNTITIYFQAFQNELEKSKNDIQDSKKQLAVINLKSDKFEIFPIVTFPDHVDYLEAKYSNIKSITLDGFNINKAKTIEDFEDILNDMPTGFIKNYEYGLGLQKDYRFIIDTISKINNITNLVISKSLNTQIKDSSFILNYSDYEKIRKGINAITRKYQQDILNDKIIYSHNSLLYPINPDVYPEKFRPYKKDTIFKMVSNNFEKDISQKDRKSIVKLIRQNKTTIYQNEKEEILNFINEIELINYNGLKI
ncbi:MAG: hypothetical protein M0R77_20860 [Gammaproteobacteria bacterium]|nr:hypothetical protein [Gammaproteobacteria bacterium]